MPVSLIVPGPPDELKTRFLTLRTIRDVARLLMITEEHLNYLAYYRRKGKYRTFTVKKRRGGRRTLAEPFPPLKLLQKRLLSVLSHVYKPRSAVHGFTSGRSIAKNAQKHAGRRLVLNLDLLDFFPSVNFGRVRGMLLAKPYLLGGPAATVLAQLCCYKNSLPQGAPTSPIISNMICRGLDRELELLARKVRCTYTRYADDLTFSTDEAQFRHELIADSHAEPVVLGARLRSAIESHGFQINEGKIRIQSQAQRQEVTGLTVNSKPNVQRHYIRRTRAMLHAWEKYGHDAAERVFIANDTKDRGPYHQRPKFGRVVKGRLDFLAMVRGNDDAVYLKFIKQYAALNPSYRPLPVEQQRPRHLKTYRDAIWVLEGESQGTAFELEGYGLISCDHVVGGQMQVYRPGRPEVRYPVEILARDRELDVAVLRFGGEGGFLLKRSLAGVSQGTPVKLLGCPQHSTGSSLYEELGSVAGIRRHMQQERILVTMRIVAGSSGSPVIDSSGRVIGIAATGDDKFEEERAVQYGVIPIGTLDKLAV